MIVSIKALEKGMVIDSDIFSKKGALLLYKGFKIENPDLVKVVLQRNGITEIVVKDDDQNPSKTPIVVESQEIKMRIEHEIRIFKEEFTEILDDIKSNVEDFEATQDVSKIEQLDSGADLAKTYEDNVLTMFQMVEKLKKEDTDEYSTIMETSLLVYSLGKWLNLQEQELKKISEASILSNIFDLTDFDISKDINEIKGKEAVSEDVLIAATQVHERMDGSGYPRGLSREEIHPYAKIISIIQVYQNLTKGNELAQKLPVFEAIKLMETEYITKLDVAALYVFLHRLGSKFIGSSVKLSNGEQGEIVFVPEHDIALPYVRLSDGHVINLQAEEHHEKNIIEIL